MSRRTHLLPTSTSSRVLVTGRSLCAMQTPVRSFQDHSKATPTGVAFSPDPGSRIVSGAGSGAIHCFIPRPRMATEGAVWIQGAGAAPVGNHAIPPFKDMLAITQIDIIWAPTQRPNIAFNVHMRSFQDHSKATLRGHYRRTPSACEWSFTCM
ncbi:hypothetical protein JB92DRAFT_1847126 [Gautieria morchelliformis]|nr:hypothetical protein JB92DRAFT_1847126 [Gautieria morchelliformis]